MRFAHTGNYHPHEIARKISRKAAIPSHKIAELAALQICFRLLTHHETHPGQKVAMTIAFQQPSDGIAQSRIAVENVLQSLVGFV